MRGAYRICVGIGGGLAAVALTFGAFWLGGHSPEWLFPTIVLASVFTGGAMLADELRGR